MVKNPTAWQQRRTEHSSSERARRPFDETFPSTHNDLNKTFSTSWGARLLVDRHQMQAAVQPSAALAAGAPRGVRARGPRARAGPGPLATAGGDNQKNITTHRFHRSGNGVTGVAGGASRASVRAASGKRPDVSVQASNDGDPASTLAMAEPEVRTLPPRLPPALSSHHSFISNRPCAFLGAIKTNICRTQQLANQPKRFWSAQSYLLLLVLSLHRMPAAPPKARSRQRCHSCDAFPLLSQN